MNAPPPEHYVSVDGCRLWCWDTGGDGPPLVLLHPGSQSGECWEHQIAYFSAAGLRVIGYSRRGHHKSSGDAHSPGVAALDLQAVLDHFGIASAHLLGVALGAFHALDLTLLRPSSVRSVVLACSYLGIDALEQDYAEANRRLRPPGFEALPVHVKELHPSYRVANQTGTDRWIALAQRSCTTNIIQARPAPVTWASMRSINTPVLLLGGDADLYAPPPLIAMQAARLPGARVETLSQCGHAPYWEQPEAFNQHVVAFIRDHEPRLQRQGSVPPP